MRREYYTHFDIRMNNLLPHVNFFVLSLSHKARRNSDDSFFPSADNTIIIHFHVYRNKRFISQSFPVLCYALMLRYISRMSSFLIINISIWSCKISYHYCHRFYGKFNYLNINKRFIQSIFNIDN